MYYVIFFVLFQMSNSSKNPIEFSDHMQFSEFVRKYESIYEELENEALRDKTNGSSGMNTRANQNNSEQDTLKNSLNSGETNEKKR